MAKEPKPPASIVCPKCGLRSFHPKDVEHRFCAICGWHKDILRELKMSKGSGG